MIERHFYVQPSGERVPETRSYGGVKLTARVLVQGCARAGCGLAPEHPVHLRQSGPTEERSAVAG